MDIGQINWMVIKPKAYTLNTPLNLGNWTKLPSSLQENVGSMIANKNNLVIEKAKTFKKYFIELEKELFNQEEGFEIMVGNIIENLFHVDNIVDLSEEKLKQLTTSIFYINTNNGYTIFEDGTKVESVANRLLTFPTNMKHTGTSCTDEKTRIVINFNYFK